MKQVAIVHDWLMDAGGAEKSLQSIYKLYPDDLYLLFAKEQTLKDLAIDPARVHTSILQKLFGTPRWYRSLLVLFPFAVERLPIQDYELVISSSHSVAKGVRTTKDQLHICYCYSPMRYAWDLREQYLRESGLDRGLKGWLARTVLDYVKNWDYKTRHRPDHYVAISHFIAQRIKNVYGIDADVIYPPVNVDHFDVREKKDDFYLTASRMVPYKKIDLIVEAFGHMPDKKLIVIGDGPDYAKIAAKAGANVTLMGRQSFDVLRDHLERAKAFIFAPEEDFGIVPLEAQACGTPVIAYGKGGSLETVKDDISGLFFDEQSVKSLCAAVERFEARKKGWDAQAIRAHAEKFSRSRFEKEFQIYVEDKRKLFKEGKHESRARS